MSIEVGKNSSASPLPSTRRQLLKSMGLSLIAGGVWTETIARASPAANDKLQLGVIGVANRGETNLIGVHGENIAALCDVDDDYLEQRAPRYPHARKYADYRQMLEQTDLDGVVISSPDHTHAHAAILAMRRGLHVYCEKPLATTVEEVRKMVAVAQETKVVTQTGTQHHASNGYRRAAEYVQSGVIGEVREVHCWTNRPFWPQGMVTRPALEPVPAHLHWDLWLGPAQARPYSSSYHPTNWRGFWDFGTGALGDRGPHLLDPVVWALKLTAPTKISATSAPVTDESPPEWSIVTFHFPAREDAPEVLLKWYDGGKQPPLKVAGVKRELPDNGVLLVGSRARLFLPELGGAPLLTPYDPSTELPPVTVKLPHSPGHYQEWIDACKSGQSTSCDFAYGARLTEICLLGNVALRSGQEVQWDAARGRISGPAEAERFLRREYRPDWKI